MVTSHRWISIIPLYIVLHQMRLIHISHGFKTDPANCSCGQAEEEDTAVRVLGGAVMQPLGHPSLALILQNDEIACGGTVVGHHHVLTAAHCLIDVPSLSDLKVLLGVHDAMRHDSHVRKYNIKQAIRHQGFKILRGHILVNDIALFKVDRIEFNKYIKPICLPFNLDVQRFKAAAVAGWGLTWYKGRNSRMPRVAVLSLLTNSQCKTTKLSKPFSLVPNMFNMVLCAYRHKKDACQGDSGGPLYVHDANGIAFQIGIVSFGIRCGTPGVPGLYTRLTNYLGWLEKEMHGDRCSVPS